MNIFWLDEDPETAARYHCDKHLVSQLKEYAQILSTAAHAGGFHEPDRMYKPVPQFNPKVMDWASESFENYLRLLKLSRFLHDEYRHRYGGVHKCYKVIIQPIAVSDITLPQTGFTEPPKCMADVYKTDGDYVDSYRNFYIHGKDWQLSWFKREKPPWYFKQERKYEGVES